MMAATVAYLRAKYEELLRQECGQTMVEYVMLIVLVALAVFLSSPTITSAILGVFTRTSSILAT